MFFQHMFSAKHFKSVTGWLVFEVDSLEAMNLEFAQQLGQLSGFDLETTVDHTEGWK